ncbi:MAG: hypothetical protein J1F37_01530 [Oscillospiraceae bacterium]|nr:hypothetical protein [Oscillospiraceae bacterium]
MTERNDFMIYYKPITNVNELKELFPNESLDENFIYGGYIGINPDGANVGKIFIKICDTKCYISSLQCDISDELLVEGFLRAALNFCANRSAYMAYCRDVRIKNVLLTLGFEENNGVYSGDIPTLLKGSCCKQ